MVAAAAAATSSISEAEPAADPSPGATASGLSAFSEAGSMLEPQALHLARIELAREDLVESNEAKERLDLEEELQRELAALQATSQTSKSRVKHATQRRKH